MPRPNKEELLEAMHDAEEAFEESLNDNGLDPAFFALRLEGYLLSSFEFKPMEKIVFEPEFATVQEYESCEQENNIDR